MKRKGEERREGEEKKKKKEKRISTHVSVAITHDASYLQDLLQKFVNNGASLSSDFKSWK